MAPCPIPEGLGEKVREPDKLMVVAVVSNVVIALESSHLSLSLLQRKKGITSWVISQEEPGVPDILTKPDILFPRWGVSVTFDWWCEQPLNSWQAALRD